MKISSVIADIIQITNRSHSDLQNLTADDHTQYALRTIMTVDGDMIYRAAGVWTRLAKAAAGKVLTSGDAPSWGLPVDLAIASQAAGDILYFNGTNWVRLTKGTTSQVLTSGDAPSWGLPVDLAIASQAQGDILYFNGTNWVRLAAGTSGYFLKTQGAAANPVWDTVPSRAGVINIFPPFYQSSTQGTWTLDVNAIYYLNAVLKNETAAANGDNIHFNVDIPPGTYTLKLMYSSSPNAGILDIDLGGTEIASIDTYAATGTSNNILTDTGNVVSTGGILDLVLRVDGKNASSGGYKVFIGFFSLIRTA